ncbi:hypothetical protein, partial [Caballeronia sp. ASUFL_M2_KS1A]|uniref:hypothetical protein n=1 Tax=Enterobacter agglomerans TaxID=549 RepID=UPI00202916EA
RGPDLNRRPSGYEPDELPGCSTPRPYCFYYFYFSHCDFCKTAAEVLVAGAGFEPTTFGL